MVSFTAPAGVNASVISRVLATAGHKRSAVLPGGRSGVLSPVSTGYHVHQYAPAQVHVYWRGTATDDERRGHLADIAAVLAARGYRADPGTAHQSVPILRVTLPAATTAEGEAPA